MKAKDLMSLAASPQSDKHRRVDAIYAKRAEILYIIIFALAVLNKSSSRQKGNLMCGVKTALRAARLGINFHQRR